MSVKLKKLIHQRQIAFHKNKNNLSYKFYRNAVNKERKRCKAAYYASKVKDLKGVNQRKWWDEINKLSGSKKEKLNLQCSLNIPEYNDKTNPEIANAINEVRVNYREGGLYVIYSPEDAQRPRAVYHIQPNFEVIN
jgi:hypothetical protein